MAGVLTLHSPGNGGASEIHDLNGRDLRRFIDRDCFSAMLTIAADAGMPATTAARSTVGQLRHWMQLIKSALLHSREWTVEERDAWRSVVLNDIQQNWWQTTGEDAFPQLHMLRHTFEFAERHRVLGRAGESQIESYHAYFNTLFQHTHRNSARDPPQRYRRCAADSALHTLEPILLA